MKKDPYLELSNWLRQSEFPQLQRGKSMARSREKAASMLNRWTQMKLNGIDDNTVFQRPVEVKEVKKLNEAETWRRQCLKEIDDKVATIQNPALGEHRTRDLNDEINKLLLELRIWEKRIIELNGPDYTKLSKKLESSTILEIEGYKYFGEARNLPGVKELHEKRTYVAPKRTRNDLMKSLDHNYFGYNEVGDIALEKLEMEAEQKQRDLHTSNFEELQKNKKLAQLDLGEKEVPSEDQIQKMLLEKRKREILAKYK
jgi:pre-mRNA-splicing factor ISY1